jgi:raffinose/stachyose/melibiose transport system substrate-binding protein
MLGRVRTRWRGALLSAFALAGSLAVVGCGGPGSSSTNTSSSTATSATTASAQAPDCGQDPITLKGYFETGFPIYKALTDEFSKQFPNVKWDIREDQFAVITQNAPRVLADDPPDLMRLPQVSELVKNHLLKDLDGYA